MIQDESPFREPSQEEKAEEEKPKPVALTPIMVDENGIVRAKDNSELLRFCHAMINAEAVPARFDNPTKLFGALQFARSLNLPDAAIRQVANIEGTMTIFGDLPLALTERTGELAFFKEQWFDKSYNVICFENKNLHEEPWGAVCFVARNRGEIKGDVQSFSFTFDDGERAGKLPAPPKSVWSKYYRIMLRYKARSIALKSLFADALSGVSIAEYDFDEMPGMKDVTPRRRRSSEDASQVLNEAMADQ